MALLFLLVVAAWSGGLTGPYQFDDRVTPLTDPASQSLTAWGKHLSITLRPLTKLTYALEASIGWGDTPAPRRLVSIFFLAAGAVLLMRIAIRLAPLATPGMAFLGAILWAVHPVHSENLLQVSGRTVILSTLLVLAALLAGLHDRRWLSAGLLVLAGLARETALAAVLVLAVVEWGRREQPSRRPIRWDWIPLLTAGLVLVIWYASTSRYWELADYSFLGRPYLPSLSAQIAAVPVGLKLLANPAGLSVDYGIALPRTPVSTGFAAGVTVYGVLAAALAAGLWKRMPALAAGAAICLAAILPTQSLVPKLDPLTSRPLTLVLAGLLIAALPLGEFLALQGRLTVPTLLALGTGLAIWLGSWTLDRQKLYASELLLWGDAAAKSVVNSRPHLYYALLLKEEGRLAEARSELETAGRIDPFDSRIAAIRKQLEQTENEP